MIIDSNDIKLGLLRIVNVNLHIHIKNVCIVFLSLIKCQNLIIENCHFTHLAFTGCRNITVRNNSILLVTPRYSRLCTFENNKIPQDCFDKLNSGYHEKIGKRTFWGGLVVIIIVIFYYFMATSAISSSNILSHNYYIIQLIFVSSIALGIWGLTSYGLTIKKAIKYPVDNYNKNIISKESEISNKINEFYS